NRYLVLEPRGPRLDQGVDDVVLTATRGDVHAMVVHVRCIDAHGAAVAAIRRVRVAHDHGHCPLHFDLHRIVVLDAVNDVEHKLVAGINAQRGRFDHFGPGVVVVTIVGVAGSI